MVSETRSARRSRTRSSAYQGSFAGLEVGGQSSPEDTYMASPSTPSRRSKASPKTPSPRVGRTRGSNNVNSGETAPSPSKRKRESSSAESSASTKRHKGEQDDGTDSSEQMDGPESEWPLCLMRLRNFRNTYRRGQVIRLAIPQPNLNPELTLTNKYLYPTRIGGVYSKKRMAVVLYRFTTRMIVLPLYSWNGRGILSRPTATHCDYVEICDDSERKGYDKKGLYDVLGVVMNIKPLTKLGCLSLAGAFSVDYREDIEILGAMIERDHKRMQRIMAELMKKVAKDDD